MTTLGAIVLGTYLAFSALWMYVSYNLKRTFPWYRRYEVIIFPVGALLLLPIVIVLLAFMTQGGAGL